MMQIINVPLFGFVGDWFHHGSKRKRYEVSTGLMPVLKRQRKNQHFVTLFAESAAWLWPRLSMNGTSAYLTSFIYPISNLSAWPDFGNIGKIKRETLSKALPFLPRMLYRPLIAVKSLIAIKWNQWSRWGEISRLDTANQDIANIQHRLQEQPPNSMGILSREFANQ